MTEPLRFSFDVDCPVDHAFRVWTAGIGTWWPADHSGHGGGRARRRPRADGVGGRIFERTADGTEHDWGEVTVWEPPDRLAYLWHLRADRADATDVSIRFRPAGSAHAGGDRASGWERLGARGGSWRERNHQGWRRCSRTSARR